jgi:hypothetical protein
MVESEAQRNLATRGDVDELKREIKDLEIRLIKWVLGTGIGVVTAIFALLKTVK